MVPRHRTNPPLVDEKQNNEAEQAADDATFARSRSVSLFFVDEVSRLREDVPGGPAPLRAASRSRGPDISFHEPEAGRRDQRPAPAAHAFNGTVRARRPGSDADDRDHERHDQRRPEKVAS